MPNRLAAEQSPYLLQHRDNPVDWYPWGEEAFGRARAEQKPIFLSIGYSTCHWCHVMAHESFESAAVADVLNRDFISIKVDREERPDVDRMYMTFVQATTGSGGWPMSVWLTPALEPFYGGTYYPPTARWGRPGFVDILREIARVWESERDRVLESAASVVERLRDVSREPADEAVPAAGVLERAVLDFGQAFDAARGGFGGGPKFPRPSELLFLLREHARTGAGEPRDMALATLRAMALGGMRDHLGGGFHRYSVDGDWRVPHFEKMLYDQVQIALAYVEASQLTGDALYQDVALDTLAYVIRDLGAPEGGFYSAEDADSVPPEQAADPDAHRTEGAFYIWRDEEVGEVLGEDAPAFRLRYGILPDGNAPADPQGEFAGRNLLYMAMPPEAVASATAMSVEDARATLARARQRLFARRAMRPRPHLDDKIIAAWNGFTIAALARAACQAGLAETTGTARGGALLERARRAATFVRTHLWDEASGRLLRRYRAGEAGIEAYAEDYAALVFGLMALFEIDGDPEWLAWAVRLQAQQDARFWDEEAGGWFSTSGADPSVLLRQKEDYDGAEPSASSIAVLNLLRLSHVCAGATQSAAIETFPSKIARTLGLFAARTVQVPRAIPMMLAALSTYHAGVSQLVIVEGADPHDALLMLDVVGRAYAPAMVTVPVWRERRESLTQLLPWIAPMEPVNARATAYLCRNFTCDRPITSADELHATLQVSKK
jgi:uncharacterized protein YyaL (SSP411 family)